jgi:DNA-binding NarL/FixJ family response regulator
MQNGILLVSRSPVLSIGIQGALEAGSAFRIVGQARNGLEAAALAGSLLPAVAVIQDALRGVSGVVTARAIREVSPRSRIVVLAEQVDDKRIVSAILHGVDALLSAGIDGIGLSDAIGRLMSGERSLDHLVLTRPEIAAMVFSAVRAVGPDRERVRANALTGREIAILDGVVRGLSNRQIADGLYVVEQTVKNHMTSLLRKLSAGDRTEAVVTAVRNGIVEIGPPVPIPPPAVPGEFFSAA